VNDAGHLPQWEQPDAFNEALLEFLRATDGPPPS
jgi:pimeloyl-ACP methyl ester carboxylesterase